MIKKQFTLYLENRAGVLNRITQKIAKSGLNIEGISAASSTDVGLVQLVADDAVALQKILEGFKISFTTQDVSMLLLDNRPGALARVISEMAMSGVNINYIYATACDCEGGCNCYAVVSAPDLKVVEKAWRLVRAGSSSSKAKKRRRS